MRTARPFFLNLLLIRLPVGAVASILHRASGAVLSLLVPLFLYGFSLSMESEAGFLRVKSLLTQHWLGQALVLVCLWALAHHFLAGLRHLGFDLGLGESRHISRRTAWLSLVLGALPALAVAVAWWA